MNFLMSASKQQVHRKGADYTAFVCIPIVIIDSIMRSETLGGVSLGVGLFKAASATDGSGISVQRGTDGSGAAQVLFQI